MGSSFLLVWWKENKIGERKILEKERKYFFVKKHCDGRGTVKFCIKSEKRQNHTKIVKEKKEM